MEAKEGSVKIIRGFWEINISYVQQTTKRNNTAFRLEILNGGFKSSGYALQRGARCLAMQRIKIPRRILERADVTERM